MKQKGLRAHLLVANIPLAGVGSSFLTAGIGYLRRWQYPSLYADHLTVDLQSLSVNASHVHETPHLPAPSSDLRLCLMMKFLPPHVYLLGPFLRLHSAQLDHPWQLSSEHPVPDQ